MGVREGNLGRHWQRQGEQGFECVFSVEYVGVGGGSDFLFVFIICTFVFGMSTCPLLSLKEKEALMAYIHYMTKSLWTYVWTLPFSESKCPQPGP